MCPPIYPSKFTDSLYHLFQLSSRFVVLSPCGFIAGNYILLGRLSRHLDLGHYLIVPPAQITKIFVTSDITTFWIQAAGGGLSTSASIKTAESGAHVSSTSFILTVYAGLIYKTLMREPSHIADVPRRPRSSNDLLFLLHLRVCHIPLPRAQTPTRHVDTFRARVCRRHAL